MPDKVILDHKKSYLVSFENFHFFSIFSENCPYVKKSKKFFRSGNNPNTFKNTPEDVVDTFCDIISQTLTSKYRPDFLD